MKFYTYDRWVKLNISDDELDELQTDCIVCGGNGYEECNLGHEHECEECDGEGTVGGNVLEVYRQKALSDIAKWCTYTGNLSSQSELVKEFNSKFEALSYSKDANYI